jgi:hypothetical protein
MGILTLTVMKLSPPPLVIVTVLYLSLSRTEPYCLPQYGFRSPVVLLYYYF